MKAIPSKLNVNPVVKLSTYLVKIAYDGSSFYGWAKQPHHKTIEGEINRTLSRVFHLPIIIQGASRTDRGVHAFGQLFTFQIPFQLAPDDLMRLLKHNFSQNIKVIAVNQVANDFDLLHEVKTKTYQYFINIAEPDPFQVNYQYFVAETLSVDMIKTALDLFLGTHYFYHFSGLKPESDKSRYRTITEISVNQNKDQIKITITGNGFLRYQVRYLIAASLHFACGKMTLAQIEHYLDPNCKNKYRFGKLPATGLYLNEINLKENKQ